LNTNHLDESLDK